MEELLNSDIWMRDLHAVGQVFLVKFHAAMVTSERPGDKLSTNRFHHRDLHLAVSAVIPFKQPFVAIAAH